MPSQTKENYLKALYHLSRKGDKITISELSKQMEVRIPTANSMVKRLQENGWVVYEKYKPLEITAEGRKAAALIIRKHRIAEMFLVEKMGFGWEEVHNIAEEIEHVNSEAFFDKMDEMLGFPTLDPHGSPIPDKDGFTKANNFIPLSDVEAGKEVILSALKHDSHDFLKHLNEIQLELGLKLKVLSTTEFDGSSTIQYRGSDERTLSKMVTEKLLVREL